MKVMHSPHEGRTGNFRLEKCAFVSTGGRIRAGLMWCRGDVRQRLQTEVERGEGVLTCEDGARRYVFVMGKC